jgi:ferredoxin
LITALLLWLFGERWRILRSSTWRFMRKFGLRKLFSFNALHGYIYGRWTNQYISFLIYHVFPRLGKRGKKWLSDRYHSKVLTHEHAKSIITLDRDISLHNLEQVIPYPIARDLVLKGPPDVAVYECACRHARAQPCQPIQVCMVVGKPFVDFILEHHPKTSLRLTQAEALELLRAEHERGHLHSAWFKDACLERFYVICNCCKCCCDGVEAMTKYGIPMMASSGYVVQVDNELCNFCGVCVDVCPFDALSLNETNVVIDWERCMGCSVCVGQCSSEAMSLKRDERKGAPMDVRFLKSFT